LPENFKIKTRAAMKSTVALLLLIFSVDRTLAIHGFAIHGGMWKLVNIPEHSYRVMVSGLN
jgi:hypothetical protein